MAGTAERRVDSTLRSRPAGYAVIQKCLDVQAEAAPQGRVARFFGASPLHPDARSWYQGALGELETAAALDRLGPEWTVLHSVPIGSGTADIDHIVIGPGGVFTINTKHHAGKKVWAGGNMLTVGGQKTEHIRNARHEAAGVAERLRMVGAQVAVTPLIVIVGAASMSEGKKPAAVEVLAVERLHRWLTKQRGIHNAKAVAYYTELAEQRTTWHTTGGPVTDVLRRTQRFARLQRDVDAARKRRHRWALGSRAAAACVLAGGLLSLPGLIGSVMAAMP
jgi:hypothetical protein